MTVNKKPNKTQKTSAGHEIPIPKRDDVLKVFKKAATHTEEKPAKQSGTSRPKK